MCVCVCVCGRLLRKTRHSKKETSVPGLPQYLKASAKATWGLASRLELPSIPLSVARIAEDTARRIRLFEDSLACRAKLWGSGHVY